MFTKILIGIDGGEGGRDALALARDLAAPAAALVLGAVWQRGAGTTAAIIAAPHPATTARELLDSERLIADVDCTFAIAAASSPAGGLHEIAEELACDLIVVGSSGRQHAGRVLLSGGSRAALHGASCAMAVAPRGYAIADGRIRRVGVGYQETALGRATLDNARRLATELGADLDVLEVVPPLPVAWIGAPFAYLTALGDAEGQQARAAKERLAALDGCTTHVASGLAVPHLRALSAEVDLLVLGSRSFGPVRRMLLGSTSDEVIQDASCAVLILVRPVPDRLRPDANEVLTFAGG